MATESKLEEILKTEKPGGVKTPAGQPADLKTTLEKELDGEDTELAKELQRTRAEEIIARRRVAIERMRLPQNAGAGRVQDTGAGGARIQERGKEWLTDMAQGLLEKGLDPNIVGRMIDYMLGTAQAPMIGYPGAPAPAQGLSFTDMKELFKMGQESNKTDPAIAAILTKLSDKITAIETRAAQPPAPPAKSSVFVIKDDGSMVEVEAGKPIIIERKNGGGKPVDQLKEENRHSEELERIATERKYKEQVGGALADLPAKLGEGAANYIMKQTQEEKPVAHAAAGAKVEYFTCTGNPEADPPVPGCGTAIQVTPGTTKIECPKCHMVYGK